LYHFGVIAAYCSNSEHYVLSPLCDDVHLGLIRKRTVDFLLLLI